MGYGRYQGASEVYQSQFALRTAMATAMTGERAVASGWNTVSVTVALRAAGGKLRAWHLDVALSSFPGRLAMREG